MANVHDSFDGDKGIRRPFVARADENAKMILTEWRTSPRAYELNATSFQLTIVLEELKGQKTRSEYELAERQSHIECVEALLRARIEYEGCLAQQR